MSPGRIAVLRHRLLPAFGLVAVVAAGCSSVAATPIPAQTIAAATATPTASAQAAATAVATSAPTLAPTDTPTLPPTPKPTPKPTPLPALAIGLCTGAQLELTITLWEGSTGTSYAHVTAQNVSSAACNMRGTSRAQILDGHGNVIADAGSGSAVVTVSDPTYPLNPGDSINTIVTWGNWCKSSPVQKVTVSMLQPFGLGRFTAKPLGSAPIPMCYSSSQKTQVSSEAWLP